MSTPDDGLLARAMDAERRAMTDDTDDTDRETTIVPTGSIASNRTHIADEDVPLADPLTQPSFEDENGLLSGEYGRPRPREFWTAKQLGRTPPMELLKNAVARQLTGGEPIAVVDDGELQGAAADFADLVTDVYDGPHFQQKSLDNLLVDAISDMIDFGFAYWELLPSEDGAFPVAGFKPLPPLTIQHNINPETGDFEEDPAYYSVPFKRSGSTITVTTSDPTPLALDDVVVMRDPLATESDTTYGQSLATKVREWLELIIDVDVHQKRHFSDSQLPSGFLNFIGDLKDDDLTKIEQDIAEASGDPHDLVTVATEDTASWIPVGESVVDLDAISEQEWYYKLVFAAAGLNLGELGIVEGSGFAKELPALKRAVFKNLTKPMMNAVFDPQNTHVLPIMADETSVSDVPFRLTIERFDPLQEQIEREETITEYQNGLASLNEARGAFGRDGEEFLIEIDGEEHNVADLPKDILDLIKPELPSISLEDAMNGDGEASVGNFSSHSEPGPPDFEDDPVLSEREAFEALGSAYNPQAVRQLEETIELESSFLVSTAYSRATEFLQLEFEREGQQNAIYWYGSFQEWRFFNFLQANSKGKYFNRHIRGEYFYARLQ